MRASSCSGVGSVTLGALRLRRALRRLFPGFAQEQFGLLPRLLSDRRRVAGRLEQGLAHKLLVLSVPGEVGVEPGSLLAQLGAFALELGDPGGEPTEELVGCCAVVAAQAAR